MNSNSSKIETNFSHIIPTKKFISNNFKVKTSINLPSIIGYTSDDDNSSSLDSACSLDFINSKFDALTDIILNENEIPQEDNTIKICTDDVNNNNLSSLNAPKLSYMTENIFRNTQISLFNLD